MKSKDPKTVDAPQRGRFFHGNKAMKGKCLHVKAVASFYKVKEWVRKNEPEHFDAFVPKTKKKVRKMKK